MSWINPLNFSISVSPVQIARRTTYKINRHGMKGTPVTFMGTEYKSIAEASRQTGWSVYRISRAVGGKAK